MGMFGDASVHGKYKQRQKNQKGEKDRQDSCQSNVQFTGEITWLKVKEELFKCKILHYLHELSQLPGARALQGIVSF